MKLFNLICMWDFGINQEIKTLGILELNERILHVGWMWILVDMGWTHWVEQHALKSHVHPDAQNMTLFVVHFSSVTQSCLTLWDPMDCSTPGLPDHHQLLEFTQAHVHWVSDAIQPSHPLSSLSPPDFSLAHHQGLHKWVISLHQVAKVLEIQLQHQSFQWIFRTYFLSDGLVQSPCCPRDSQESSPTPQSKSINYLQLVKIKGSLVA